MADYCLLLNTDIVYNLMASIFSTAYPHCSSTHVKAETTTSEVIEGYFMGFNYTVLRHKVSE